jgi:hypothetical protein
MLSQNYNKPVEHNSSRPFVKNSFSLQPANMITCLNDYFKISSNIKSDGISFDADEICPTNSLLLNSNKKRRTISENLNTSSNFGFDEEIGNYSLASIPDNYASKKSQDDITTLLNWELDCR